MSLYVGARLMALALPDENVAWRYAIHSGQSDYARGGGRRALCAGRRVRGAHVEGKGRFHFAAAPGRTPAGPAYELTLIPFAGTGGRIASFPCVVER